MESPGAIFRLLLLRNFVNQYPNNMEKVFVFKEPQSLKDIDLSSFCQESDEKELSYSGLWLRIGQGATYYGNTSYSLEIHNGGNDPCFRYKGWTLVGSDSCIHQKWGIVLFTPTIIDPYGTLVEFGDSINRPEIYMRCYKSEDFRTYLCFLFSQFVRIADSFVTAEHYCLYDNQFSQHNGNTFYNRMAGVIHHINGEWETNRPEADGVWLNKMIKRCRALLLSPIASSVESGKFSIKEALNKYESVLAKL